MSKVEWVLVENSVFVPLSVITHSEALFHPSLTDS